MKLKTDKNSNPAISTNVTVNTAKPYETMALEAIKAKFPLAAKQLNDEVLQNIAKLPVTPLAVKPHFDPNLVILELGNQQTMVLPKGALANFTQSFRIASEDMKPRPMDMFSLSNMYPRNVTSYDFMVWPNNLLASIQLAPPRPKFNLTSTLIVMDTDGDMTINGVAGESLKFDVSEQPVIGYVGVVRRYNTRFGESVVNLDFFGSMAGGADAAPKFSFELKDDAAGGFCILSPEFIARGAYSVDLKAPEPPEVEIVGTPAVKTTPQADAFFFNLSDLILKPKDQGNVIFTGVNSNLTLYPIYADETFKAAVIQCVAANQIQNLTRILLASVMGQSK